MTRPGRRPIVDPYRSRKHISLLIPEREHAELVKGCERLQIAISELIRRAIRAYLVATMDYYYVRKESGELIPPGSEPGFTDFKVARAVAVEHCGQVIQRRWVPVGEEVTTA